MQLQERPELRGKWSVHPELFSGAGMNQLQPQRMQRNPSKRAACREIRAAVASISQQRMAFGGKLSANLMGPTGLEPQEQEGPGLRAIGPSQGRDVRDGQTFSPVGIPLGRTRPNPGNSIRLNRWEDIGQEVSERAPLCHMAFHHRQIIAGRRVGRKLFAEPGSRRSSQCEDDHTTHACVQAMHHTERLSGDPVLHDERLGGGPQRTTPRGLNRHSGWLVDGQQLGIPVQDLEPTCV